MARVFPFLFDRRIIRGTCDRRCTDHGRCREHSRTPSFKWISHGRNLLSACFDRAPATYAFIHLAIKRGVELQWKCFREFSYLSRRRRRRRRVKKFIGNCSPSSMGKCWPIFFPSSFFFFTCIVDQCSYPSNSFPSQLSFIYSSNYHPVISRSFEDNKQIFQIIEREDQ